MAVRVWCFFLCKKSKRYCNKIYHESEEHHKTKSFSEEYLKMLNDFEVEYEDKYLFEFYE